jgi:alkylation response protein AidB-like acyl-CoA dehydrogenase
MEERSSYPAQYRGAREFERYLGDPSNPSNVFCFERALELDERDEYPEEACGLLDRWGLPDYYVPAQVGGRLNSYEELMSLMRVVARRDLTVIIAHAKTYLGAVAVWVGGDARQKQRLAGLIKEGVQVALALTEKEHGSDLLRGEVKATGGGDGYLLSGEKWLINNATRSAALTVLARTEPKGGPRGFSLLLVEKEGLGDGSYAHLPRLKTHGIRGADISGIRFKECPLPADALIAAKGDGLEIILKALQVTRTIIPALSLGAGDSALRTTLAFAVSRKLYGGSVFDIPHARGTLVDAFLDQLAGECTALAAVRALHVAPEQASVLSAVAKYFVPTTVENLIGSLSVVLGARSYLRDNPEWGVFQKIVRDNAIASLFDGSTVVNLNATGLQLPQLCERYGSDASASPDELQSRLRLIFDLDARLPLFAPEKLSLTARGRNDVLQGIRLVPSRLRELEGQGDVDAATLAELSELARRVTEEIGTLQRSVKELSADNAAALDKSPEVVELSKQYCFLNAAAACLQIWIYNRDRLDEFFARGEWLVLCLDRLLKVFASPVAPTPRPHAANVAQGLLRLYQENRMFSIIPFELTSATERTAEG